MKFTFYTLTLLFFFSYNFAIAQLIHDFKVNDDTAGNVFRYNANISTNKNGLSAVVWEEYILGNIFAQIYNNNFVKINNNFKVNATLDSCSDPDIIVTEKNKIGIIFRKYGVPSNNGIYFNLFNGFGNPLTSAIKINDSYILYPEHPKIGCDSSGRFIIVWDYMDYNSNHSSVYFQIIDSSGNKIGNNVKVNEDTASFGPEILVRKNGSFIIVWSGISYNIYLQRFNRNGIPMDVKKKVNDTLYYMEACGNPKVVSDSSGNFVVAFKKSYYLSSMNYVIYQRYDMNGIKIGNNKELVGTFTDPLSSFDSDEIGNLIFQLNLGYAMNIRINRFDNPIGTFFIISNEYLDSGKYAQDVKLFNNKIINVWMDMRLTTQPQIYANVRSYINPDSTVGIIKISSEVPNVFKLYQNYPNPFNPITKIKFDIPKSEFVTIRIYDILGREIKTLVNEFKNAGSYIVSFNGSELANGIYFYRIQAGDFVSVKRMVLIK